MFIEEKKNKTLLTVYVAIGILIALPTLLFIAMLMPQHIVTSLKYSVLVLFVVNVFVSMSRQRMPLYHPYLIFLGMMGLFLLSRVAFDVFGGTDFAQTTQFSDYIFDVEVQRRLLINVYLALFGLQIGAIISTSKDPISVTYPKEDVDWKKIGLILFYIGLPFLIYQYLMVGLEVMEKGYGARLRGELVYRNTILTTFMARVALGGFFFYLAGSPKGRWFYIHLTVFLLAFYLQLLEGARYYAMCFSLVLFSLYFIIRAARFRFINVVWVLGALFVLSAGVGILRSNNKTVERDWAVDFVSQQGIALQIVGHAVEHKEAIDYHFIDMFAHTRYRIDLIKERITGEPAVRGKDQIMDKYQTLAFQLTHQVNAKALSGGWDMASSYLAEFFLLGREWLVFFGNILVGFITVFFSNRAIRNKYGILLLLYILPYWIFIPRDNIFDFITDNMSNACFALLILVLVKVFGFYNSKYKTRSL